LTMGKECSRCWLAIVIAGAVAVNILLFPKVVLTNGFPMHSDFNFPLYSENFIRYYYPTWNDITSQSNIERIVRLVMLSPFLFLARLGVPVNIIIKIYIIYVYALGVTFFYLFASELARALKVYDENLNEDKAKPLLFLTALVYAYSVPNLQFIGGITILYSVFVFLFIMYISLLYVQGRLARIHYPVLVAVSLLFSAGHPYTLIVNTILALFLLLVFRWILNGTPSLKRIVTSTLLDGAIVLVFFTLLFAWFILVYINNPISAATLRGGEERYLSYEWFNELSQNYIHKIILLERDKVRYIDSDPDNLALNIIHYVALGSIVVMPVIVTLLVWRSERARELFGFRDAERLVRLLAVFIGLYALFTLLALGTRTPIGDLYWELVVSSPIGWAFRSPLKNQLYQVLMIAGPFAIASLMLGRALTRISKYGRLVTAGLILFIFLGSSGWAIVDVNRVFSPVSIPEQYFEINSILEEVRDPYKVEWYPRYLGKETTWSEGRTIQPFDQKSSRKPTYITYWNYYYVEKYLLKEPFLKKYMVEDYFPRYLGALAIKYIAYHNDRGFELDKTILDGLLDMANRGVIEKVYASGEWYLFNNTSVEVSPRIRIIKSLAVTNDTEIMYSISTNSLGVVLVDDYNTAPYSLGNQTIFYISGNNVNGTIPNLLRNAGLENWTEKGPEGWTVIGKRNADILVSEYSVEGKYSMLVIPKLTKEKKWVTIVSPTVNITVGATYIVSFWVDSAGVEGTHVKVQLFDTNQEKWINYKFIAINITDTGGWKHYYKPIYITGGNYTAMRIVVNVGWKMSDNVKPHVYIDRFGVYSPELEAETWVETEYKHVSPTLWLVTVRNVEPPYVVVLTETYDPAWRARVYLDGDLVGEVKPFKLYGVVNGFLISKDLASGTVDRSVTIEIVYVNQESFNTGLAISVLAAVAVVLASTLALRRMG